MNYRNKTGLSLLFCVSHFSYLTPQVQSVLKTGADKTEPRQIRIVSTAPSIRVALGEELGKPGMARIIPYLLSPQFHIDIVYAVFALVSNSG